MDEPKISMSPLPVIAKPVEKVLMDFNGAVREMLGGKRVVRKEWEEACWCFLKDEIMTIFRNGKENQWVISRGDLEGRDWFVI